MVRGGFGIYYSRIEGHIGFVNDLLGKTQQINQVFIPLTGLAGINSPLTGGRLTSAEIYQTLLARGVLGQRGILPEDLAPHGIVPGPGYPLRIGFRVADDVVNPYSLQGSFESSAKWPAMPCRRPITSTAASTSSGRWTRTFTTPAAARWAGHRFRASTPTHLSGQRVWQLGKIGLPCPDRAVGEAALGRVFDLGASHLEQGHGRGHRLQFPTSRTFRGTPGTNAPSPPITADTVLSQCGRPVPVGGRPGARLRTQPASGFHTVRNRGGELVRAIQPDHRFDSLGDRHTDTHRPWGLGRNAGIGPDFFSVDMRLTRTIPLSETVNLQVIGEAFNLLNRTNFKTVNGVVGNALH